MEELSELLSKRSVEILKDKRNILAFSSGVDSTALFFLLHEAGIEFDMAIVDYGLRSSSKDELAYAKELAKEYKKEIFIKEATKIRSNFEKEARDIRYNFFKRIINSNNYQNLITAHQLNDRLEWFLMQMAKGAGLVEVLGFDEIEKRDGYQIVRPLLDTKKSDLLNYLKMNGYRYFVDESNFSHKYQRNYIRDRFANALIDEFGDGIRRSFLYLQKDKDLITNSSFVYRKIKDLYILKRGVDDIRGVDRTLKKMGYLLSAKQRDEIEGCDEVVVGAKFVISKTKSHIYICPYKNEIMSKEFKERCRVLRVPQKIRSYLYVSGIELDYLPSSSV